MPNNVPICSPRGLHSLRLLLCFPALQAHLDALILFAIAAVREVMGAALHVKLPTGLEVRERTIVKISYETSKSSGALQWLSKAHTHGKDFPYLYSQCQPIYARALVPIQDMTTAKFKYSATVVSKFPVLLSALCVSPPVDGPAHDGKIVGEDFITYTYNQPIPIPPYLIAIASGNVCYRAFPQYRDQQWKTGVWAEPGQLESAYWEFSEDTPRFLATAEALLTLYEYGVYNLLVLPPASLYGGMEHPCLTFLTPSMFLCIAYPSIKTFNHISLAVVTGDCTLVDVVIHEITHSWFAVEEESRVRSGKQREWNGRGSGVYGWETEGEEDIWEVDLDFAGLDPDSPDAGLESEMTMEEIMEWRYFEAKKEKELGNVAFRKGDYNAAAKHYESAHTVEPELPHYQLNLAAVHIKFNHWIEAEKACTTALSQHCNKAIQDLCVALKVQPTNAEALAKQVSLLPPDRLLPKSRPKSNSNWGHVGLA
ncbi:peptidase family M1-domain-containing protein [Collybia nuda]|uniref:Peptidase family M1-domain-containing protein n=1 Tax=Collybia nuda TaxID=64659 RepID=A0A9P5XU29_9AGAR|nr:peptidase family M1-domain-containing protein [Collybia nuda]